MRAFLAIEIPYDLKRYLTEVVKEIAPYVDDTRWVREDGYHITLKFLGDIGNDKVEEINGVLPTLKESYTPFEVSLGGISGLPDQRRPRVIVVTIENGIDIIGEIYHHIEEAIALIGFERERRPYRPHVTIGRRKSQGPIPNRVFLRLADKPFVADGIVLFKSTLTSRGAIYEPLWKISFTGGRR